MQTKVDTKASLIKHLLASNAEIKSFGVKSLSIFGSFAKDTHIRPDSDVDFLVDFEPDKKPTIILSIYPFTLKTCWDAG